MYKKFSGNGKIDVAVVLTAGKGMRVMPLTLHQPKAMIGIVDRPIIHYVVDEIIAAGIRHVIIVASPDHRSTLEKYLEYQRKNPEWASRGIRFDFAIQKLPKGQGDAILSARAIINNRPFLLCFSDDLLIAQKAPLQTLVKIFEKNPYPIIALERVPWEDVPRYGVVKTENRVRPPLHEIVDVVEKPSRESAPSNLSIIGRYIITPDLLPLIEMIGKNLTAGKENYITDAFRMRLQSKKRILGWEFKGQRFDCGSKIGLLKAQVYFGVHHPDFREEMKSYVKTITSLLSRKKTFHPFKDAKRSAQK